MFHICTPAVPEADSQLLHSAMGLSPTPRRTNYIQYRCAACPHVFDTICLLHDHLTGHAAGGSYFYDHMTGSAFPRYDTACMAIQVKPKYFEKEPSASDKIIYPRKKAKKAACNEMVIEYLNKPIADETANENHVPMDHISSPVLTDMQLPSEARLTDQSVQSGTGDSTITSSNAMDAFMHTDVASDLNDREFHNELFIETPAIDRGSIISISKGKRLLEVKVDSVKILDDGTRVIQINEDSVHVHKGELQKSEVEVVALNKDGTENIDAVHGTPVIQIEDSRVPKDKLQKSEVEGIAVNQDGTEHMDAVHGTPVIQINEDSQVRKDELQKSEVEGIALNQHWTANSNAVYDNSNTPGISEVETSQNVTQTALFDKDIVTDHEEGKVVRIKKENTDLNPVVKLKDILSMTEFGTGSGIKISHVHSINNGRSAAKEQITASGREPYEHPQANSPAKIQESGDTKSVKKGRGRQRKGVTDVAVMSDSEKKDGRNDAVGGELPTENYTEISQKRKRKPNRLFEDFELGKKQVKRNTKQAEECSKLKIKIPIPEKTVAVKDNAKLKDVKPITFEPPDKHDKDQSPIVRRSRGRHRKDVKNTENTESKPTPAIVPEKQWNIERQRCGKRKRKSNSYFESFELESDICSTDKERKRKPNRLFEDFELGKKQVKRNTKRAEECSKLKIKIPIPEKTVAVKDNAKFKDVKPITFEPPDKHDKDQSPIVRRSRGRHRKDVKNTENTESKPTPAIVPEKQWNIERQRCGKRKRKSNSYFESFELESDICSTDKGKPIAKPIEKQEELENTGLVKKNTEKCKKPSNDDPDYINSYIPNNTDDKKTSCGFSQLKKYPGYKTVILIDKGKSETLDNLTKKLDGTNENKDADTTVDSMAEQTGLNEAGDVTAIDNGIEQTTSVSKDGGGIEVADGEQAAGTEQKETETGVEPIEGGEKMDQVAEQTKTDSKHGKGKNKPGVKIGYECEVCNRTVLSETSIERHMLIHTNREKLVCEICGVSVFNITKHMKTHKEDKVVSKRKMKCRKEPATGKSAAELILKDMFSRVEPEEGKPHEEFVCRLCSKVVRRANIAYHRRTHKTVRDNICEICGKDFAIKSCLTAHLLTHNRPWKCDYCPARFPRQVYKDTHQRLHTKENPYACELCGAAFRNIEYAKKHIREVHATKDVTCNICSEKFRNKKSLWLHKEKHQPMTIRCGFCPKMFRHNTECKTHEKFHTGEKNFHCPICNHGFVRNGPFYKHMQRKHDIGRGEAKKWKNEVNLQQKIKRSQDGENVTDVTVPIEIAAGASTQVKKEDIGIETEGDGYVEMEVTNSYIIVSDNGVEGVETVAEMTEDELLLAVENGTLDSNIFVVSSETVTE